QYPRVIYDIDHLTAYSYQAPVTSASLALRLSPRNTLTQRPLSHEVRISPEPEHATSHRDFYDNVVDLVTIGAPHTELEIRSLSRVEVMPRPGLTGPDLPWETVAGAALAERDLSAAGPSHFLFPSPRITLSRDVTRYARDSFGADR